MNEPAMLLRSLLAIAVALTCLVAGSAQGAGYISSPGKEPVHPSFSYRGVEGRADIALCPDPSLYIATRNVAAAYNRRDETLGNILSATDPLRPPSNKLDIEGVLAHEMGHVLGLRHAEQTPASIGGNAPAWGVAPSSPGPNNVLDAAPGPDGIFGTQDDLRGDDRSDSLFPLNAGNNPFFVPPIVDRTTMSTDLALRDQPGTWPYVSWRPVSEALGLPPTSSVMTAGGIDGVKRRPSPQEITLLKYAESGADGRHDTEDDYQYFLYVVDPATPASERPVPCTRVRMQSSPNFQLFSAAAFVSWVNDFSLASHEPCLSNAKCFLLPHVTFNPDLSWHYPTVDTSNGEADFVPAPEFPVAVEMSKSTVVVTAGFPETITAAVRTRDGSPLPAGSVVRFRHENGLISINDPSYDGTGIDVSGKTEHVIDIDIDGDQTASRGPLFVVATAPGLGRGIGRTDIFDQDEEPTLYLAPRRIQLPTTMPAATSPIHTDVTATVRQSVTQSPVPGQPVVTSACTVVSLQGAFANIGTGCLTLSGLPCPVLTDAAGQVTLSTIAYSDGAGLLAAVVGADTAINVAVQPIVSKIDLTAAITAPGGAALAAANDILTITLIATNAGQETLSGVSVSSDRTLGTDCVPAILSPLQPGQSMTCTSTYQVSEGDVDFRHPITVSANASASSPNAPSLFAEATARRPLVQGHPALTIQAEASLVDSVPPNNGADAGETIEYSVTVQNTGGLTLTDIALDTGDAASTIVCPAAPVTLQPGASVLCAVDYEVTDGDVAAQVDVAPVLRAVGGSADGAIDATTTAPVRLADTTGAMTLAAAAALHDTVRANGMGDEGELIVYTLTARNVGETVLAGVSIALSVDDTLVCTPGAGAALVPGAAMQCTGSYRITIGDFAAQLPIIAEASAVATAPGGPVAASTTARTAVAFSEGHVALSSSFEIIGHPTRTVAQVGDSVRYRFQATNTGGRPLINVRIEPSLGGPECRISPPARLEPGNALSCMRDMIVGGVDAQVGAIAHTATVVAVPFIPLQPGGEAHCTVTVNPNTNHKRTAQAIIAFDQATGELGIAPDAIEISNEDRQAGEPQFVVVSAHDQFGAPMHGLPLRMACTAPARNALRVKPPQDFVSVGPDGLAVFELMLEDSGHPGSAPMPDPVHCAVQDNGFEVAVAITTEPPPPPPPPLFRDGFEDPEAESR
jgi:hypothetical protein